jgi:hypothetical protein
VNGVPRSLTNTKGDGGLSTLEPAQRAQLVALKRMRARGAVLDPAHVEHRAIEVHLVPAEVADFGIPQPMPKRNQDHGRVSMAATVGLGGIDQGLDLAGRQVLASPQFHVRPPRQCNCSENLSWRV